MFVLDGNELIIDRPFNHKGLQYPPEWLRFSTPEQKKELGIVEIPDDAVRQRKAPEPIRQASPGKVERERSGALRGVREEAHRLLSRTDWMFIRQLETGKPVPQEILDYRESIRSICDANERIIKKSNNLFQAIS